MNKRPFYGGIFFLLILGGLPHGGFGAPRDPRLKELAHSLEADDLATIYTHYFCSDGTKSVLQALSKDERKHVAQAVRQKRPSEIREGHLEQYRRTWGSTKLPDSEVIVSFPMEARSGDLTKPTIAFSSHIDAIPMLLADALEKQQMPRVLSFFEPLSPGVEVSSHLTPAERKNRVLFFRSLQLVEKGEDERVYKGPYTDSNGLLLQDEIRIRLHLDGRWIVQ